MIRIALAQISPCKGDVNRNIMLHREWLSMAAKENADLLFFSELSLTSYEPTLAESLSMELRGEWYDEFKSLAKSSSCSIALGFPLKTENGIHISMVFFLSTGEVYVYSKQRIHEDEKPFFIPGNEQLIIDVKGVKIAPAICYEAMFEEHIVKAKSLEAEVYLASVAKHQEGMKVAHTHLAEMAAKYQMPILISNAVGPCDNFVCSGNSAVWDQQGQKLDELENQEGLLFFEYK